MTRYLYRSNLQATGKLLIKKVLLTSNLIDKTRTERLTKQSIGRYGEKLQSDLNLSKMERMKSADELE